MKSLSICLSTGSIPRPAVRFLLLSFIVAGSLSAAPAQNVPTVNQSQMQCTQKQNGVWVTVPCNGGGSSTTSGSNSNGSSTHQATPGEIAVHNCIFHGKCNFKKLKGTPETTDVQQQQQQAAPPTPSADTPVQPSAADAQAADDALRAQQAAAVRQANFDALKSGTASELKDLGGGDAVDLSDLKDSAHATVPLMGGSGDAAWRAPLTDPRARRLASGLDIVVPPLPIPSADVQLTLKQIYMNPDTQMQIGERLLAAWDMEGLVTENIDLPCKVIMIAGKTFIAGEDGAALYLARKDQTYDAALAYLKNPVQSRRFARLVDDLRRNRPLPTSADPSMVAAARAIADPKLRNSGASIAWDAMISPQALAAMVRKATLEVASEAVSDKANELFVDLTRNKAAFNQLVAEREQAVKMIGLASTTPAEREQFKIVVNHANQLLADTYTLQRVETNANSMAMGAAADKIADALLGPEPKAPEK